MEDVEAEAAAFRLSFSASLSGPARCVAVDDDNTFVAATADGSARVYQRSGGGGGAFDGASLLNGQRLHGLKPGLLFALCNYNKGSFISGGSDSKALVFNIGGERLAQLVGKHHKSVNSVARALNGDIVTGSFDGSAIVWRKGKLLHHLKGHEFGVEVLALPSGEVITGSGDRERGVLRIWRDGALQKTIDSAHSHIIRRLALHPLGFVSCGNDGFVKVWSNVGDELMSLCAHPVQQDTDSFVYGVSSLPSGEIVSVGEDAFARVISAHGVVLQSIRHPSPVRDVACFPNGDFVTACTDGVVRVWTRSPQRQAEDSVIAAYEEIIELAEKSRMQGLDQSSLSDQSVLSRPGERPGQVVIVDINGKGPTVFQWDQDASTWQEIGAALGQSKKATLDGKEYDHVVDVVVREGVAPLKLGFNRSDDPAKVARDFCIRHGLGEEAVPQVKQFLLPMADPVARLAQEEKAASDLRASLKLIPCWKAEGYATFFSLTLEPCRQKLLQLNQVLRDTSHPQSCSDDNLRVLDDLIALLNDSSGYLDETLFSADKKALLNKLLSWPAEHSLPVLDLVRMLMLHASGVMLLNDTALLTLVLSHAKSGGAQHQVLVLRALANWVAKTSSKTPETAVTIDIIAEETAAFSSSPKPTVRAASVLLSHNLVSCIGRFKMKSKVALDALATSLLTFLSSPQKERPTFFAVIVLGTIASLQPALNNSFFKNSQSRLRAIVSRLKSSSNTSIVQAANEFATVVSL